MKYNEIQFLRPDPFLTEGITFLRHDPDGNCRVSTQLHPHICSKPTPALDLRSLDTNCVMSRSLGREDVARSVVRHAG